MFLYIALFLGSFARKLILTFYGMFAADERGKVCMLCVCVFTVMVYVMLCNVMLSVMFV